MKTTAVAVTRNLATYGSHNALALKREYDEALDDPFCAFHCSVLALMQQQDVHKQETNLI